MTGLKNHRKPQLKAYGIIKFCSSNVGSFDPHYLNEQFIFLVARYCRQGCGQHSCSWRMYVRSGSRRAFHPIAFWFQVLAIAFFFLYSLLCCHVLWLLGFAYVLASTTAQISLWVRKIFPVVSTASMVAVFAGQLCCGEQADCKGLQPPSPLHQSSTFCGLGLFDPFQRVLVLVHMMDTCPSAPLVEASSEYISSIYSAFHWIHLTSFL